ncbi:winged helix-turn-helix transcriptional regulator [Streptosporangium sp. NPDC087985]|uniref:winged helix-turn-helix transcriptional regulator n=1 Tax=Streptosporangium sp. NPDC087985 TaxID=3366196 RepID=UPI003809C95A
MAEPGREDTTPARPKAASPLGQALLLTGDLWNLQIIRAGFRGDRRFQDLRAELPISEAVLAGRLRDLVAEQVLETHRYTDAPPRHEYRLTERGRELWGFFVALWVWDRRWAPAADSAVRGELRHLTCGHLITPVFGCGACGAIGVTARDVTAAIDGRLLIDVTDRRSRRAPSVAPASQIDSTGVLGDRWSTFLLADALNGSRRFSDFQERLGVSPVTLTDRLNLFVEAGLMSRAPVSDGARRQEYRPTPKALDFFTVFAMLNDWAARWLSPDGMSGLSFVHRVCGEQLRPRFTCNACNGELRRDQVVVEPQGGKTETA